MEYHANAANRPSPTVREVQMMLNAIRTARHHLWDPLTVDGIYGEKSAAAVKKFQIYRGITPAAGVLGDTTIGYIRQEYQCLPTIQSGGMVMYAAPTRTESIYASRKVADDEGATLQKSVVDRLVDCLSAYDNFIVNESAYIKGLLASGSGRKVDLTALRRHYYSLFGNNPAIKGFREATARMPVGMAGLARRQADIRANSKDVIDLYKQLKNCDIVEKIKKQLKKIGINDEIKIGSRSLKVRGTGILTLWSFKDLIGDAFRVKEWGTDKWNADVRKHFSAAIDDFIVGTVSTLVAEVVVAACVGAVGVSLSAGWIIALVAIAAILIATLCEMLMGRCNFSFGDVALQRFDEITAKIRL